MARRARESAHFSGQDLLLAHLVPLGCGPCVRRTGHPFAASGPQGPSQKIELVFTASLETVSGEPEEICDFRRSLGQGGTWQSARFRILRFSFRCGFVFLRRNAGEPAYRFKVAPLAIYYHEICNQLASYSECCAVGVPLLACVLIYQREIRIPPWRQLRRFDQDPLDMFVPLLRNWCPRYFVCRSLFISAKPAVADGLSDRPET